MMVADDKPAYWAACRDEEAAVQALGHVLPTSIAGAVALLEYIADVEADFVDEQSPIVGAMLSVAKGLTALGECKAAPSPNAKGPPS